MNIGNAEDTFQPFNKRATFIKISIMVSLHDNLSCKSQCKSMFF